MLGRLLSRCSISIIDNKYYAMVSSDVENRRNVTKFQKALSFLAELREYHHTYIYKLVKSTNSPVMHIISVAKGVKIYHVFT